MAGLEEIWTARSIKGESEYRGLSLQHLQNAPRSGQVSGVSTFIRNVETFNCPTAQKTKTNSWPAAAGET
jgi:hypothetical protein